MGIRNRVASWVLDKLIALVPEVQPPADNPPLVWRFTITDYADGSPYLTRVHFPRIPILNIRPMVHKFHRPDGDRALHNHPWKWAASFILAGEYVEERLLPDESQLYGRPHAEARLVRWFNWLTDQDFHRVVELRGGVYSLFVSGPRAQEWGFMPEDGEPGEVVHWRTYIDRKRAELELPVARGEALDLIGLKFDIKRMKVGRLPYNGGLDPWGNEIAFGVYEAIEPDGAYRERILATIKGEVH